MKIAAVLLIALAACSDTADTSSSPDAAVFGLDPTGNWNVTYAFQPACNNPATTTNGTFTVTVTPMGYDIEVAGVVSQGVLLCSADACRLSGTWAWKTQDVGYEQSMNLTLDDKSTVSGAGTEAVLTADGTCTYPFTVTGLRN